MSPEEANFQRLVSTTALGVAQEHGFALGGGCAWVVSTTA
jgi:hypothetical protein